MISPKLALAIGAGLSLLLAGAGCGFRGGDPSGTDTTTLSITSQGISCSNQHRKGKTSINAVDSWSCLPGLATPGTERIYEFVSNVTGDVVVSVVDYTWYPIVTVSEGSPFNPANCIAGNYYSVRFAAVTGQTYYIAVDSDGAAGDVSFDISLSCDAPMVESGGCANGYDDDGDFDVDCQDSDCFSVCGVGGACTPVATVACDQTLLAESTASVGSADAISSYECQQIGNLTAPERAYAFTAQASGEVLVTLGDYTSYPVVSVLRETGMGCDPGDCIGQDFYGNRFQAIAGETYYIVVEAWLDETFEYDLTVLCDPPASESDLCDDKLDNDGDLYWDCEDSDCADEEICQAGGTCSPVQVVDCDTLDLPGDTVGLGATDGINAYGCAPSWTLGGNEVAYQFTSRKNQRVRVSVSDFTDYPVVSVLGGTPCDALSCLDMNYYDVEFRARRNETYYFLVEEAGIGPLTYNLSVICGTNSGAESQCANGVDDDGDALIDCEDPDCALTTSCRLPGSCSATTALSCGDNFVSGSTAAGTAGIDTYGCLREMPTTGPEVAYSFTAATTERVLVTLSNETDYAMISIMDGACDPNVCVNQNYYSVLFDAVAGQTYYFSVEGMGTSPSVSYDVSVLCNPPTFESDCSDNLDNDGDFYIDCSDPDCPCP